MSKRVRFAGAGEDSGSRPSRGGSPAPADPVDPTATAAAAHSSSQASPLGQQQTPGGREGSGGSGGGTSRGSSDPVGALEQELQAAQQAIADLEQSVRVSCSMQ